MQLEKWQESSPETKVAAGSHRAFYKNTSRHEHFPVCALRNCFSNACDKDQTFFFLLLYLIYHSPRGSAGKESACNAGDLGSIPGLGRSPGEGKGHSLQYSSLENSMNSIVHGVTES